MKAWIFFVCGLACALPGAAWLFYLHWFLGPDRNSRSLALEYPWQHAGILVLLWAGMILMQLASNATPPKGRP